MSERSRSRRHRRAVLLALALAVAVAGSWTIVAHATEQGQEPGFSLRLVDLVDRPDAFEVALRAANHSSTGRRARLWYTLSDATGQEVYRSTAKSALLEGGSDVTVSWNAAPSTMPGTYRLRGWVHVKERTEFVPAGASESRRIELQARDTPLLRVAEAGTTRLDRPTLTTSATDNPVHLEAVVPIVNQRERPRDGLVLEVGFVAAGEANGVAWQRSRAEWLPSTTATIGPQESLTVPVTVSRSLEPGRYYLRLRLLDGRTVLDDALVNQPVDVGTFDASVERSTLPAGDLMVRTVAAPGTWADSEHVDVTMQLQNLATEARTGRAFVEVAPSGSRRPWRDARGKCRPVDVEVPPSSTLDVTVSCVAAGPAGDDLTLSAWVHAANGTGKLRHSDGVFLSRRINILPSPTIVRSGSLPGDVMVTSITAPESVETAQLVEVGTALENLTGRPVRARIGWFLAPPLARKPWLEAIAQSEPLDLELAPFERRDLLLPGVADAPAGQHALVVVAQTVPADGDAFETADFAWVRAGLGVR